MKQVVRSIAAFLFAPLAATAVIGVHAGLVFLPFVLVFAYAITFSLALPAYLLMYYLNWTNCWQFCLAGVILALLPEIALEVYALLSSGGVGYVMQGGVELVVDGERTVAGHLRQLARLVVYSAGGAVTGFLFWAIAHESQEGRPWG